MRKGSNQQMNKETEVQIYGQSYRIKGDDPERIKEVAGFLDQKLTEILGPSTLGLSTRGAVLAALNIADELLSCRKQIENFGKQVDQKTQELLELTDSL